MRLPVAIEEPSSKAVDLPSYVELYRPVRERVYGVLLDVRKTDSGSFRSVLCPLSIECN